MNIEDIIQAVGLMGLGGLLVAYFGGVWDRRKTIMNSQQRYISNELTHFVGMGDKTPEKQYETLTKILREGKLMHPPSDSKIVGYDSGALVPGVLMRVCPSAKLSDNEMFNPEVVCFCDIPVDDLSIHIKKYGSFGLSFEKDFIVRRGGAPVYYIAKEAVVKIKMLAQQGNNRGELFEKLVPELVAYFDIDPSKIQSLAASDSASIDIRKLLLGSFLALHILSYIKFFDHALSDDHEDNYYFEREWRIVGRLHFQMGELRRILLPESYAKQFREDFPEYCGQLTFVSPSDERE